MIILKKINSERYFLAKHISRMRKQMPCSSSHILLESLLLYQRQSRLFPNHELIGKCYTQSALCQMYVYTSSNFPLFQFALFANYDLCNLFSSQFPVSFVHPAVILFLKETCC